MEIVNESFSNLCADVFWEIINSGDASGQTVLGSYEWTFRRGPFFVLKI